MAIVLHSGFKLEVARRQEHVASHADPAQYREFVFRCALAVCGEPDGAEDVAQEVLLVLFRTRKRLAQVEAPNAWVRQITVRCATKYLRRQRKTDQLTDRHLTIDNTSDTLAVFEVLRQLTPEQRALLGMALNQGLSYREIGDALDIPEGTVASRLNAAKKAFQRKWEH